MSSLSAGWDASSERGASVVCGAASCAFSAAFSRLSSLSAALSALFCVRASVSRAHAIATSAAAVRAFDPAAAREQALCARVRRVLPLYVAPVPSVLPAEASLLSELPAPSPSTLGARRNVAWMARLRSFGDLSVYAASDNVSAIDVPFRAFHASGVLLAAAEDAAGSHAHQAVARCGCCGPAGVAFKRGRTRGNCKHGQAHRTVFGRRQQSFRRLFVPTIASQGASSSQCGRCRSSPSASCWD